MVPLHCVLRLILDLFIALALRLAVEEGPLMTTADAILAEESIAIESLGRLDLTNEMDLRGSSWKCHLIN